MTPQLRAILNNARRNRVPDPVFSGRFQDTTVPDLFRGSGTPDFTRTTAATVWGYGPTAAIADGPTLLTVASGEARFVGARRISEGVWSSNDANGVFLSTSNGASALYGDATGPFGYLAEGQRTNRCLYSQTFQNAAWAATTMTVADNTTVAPDGTTTAATLTATAGNATLIQDLGVVASAAKAGGLWIKRKTGTGNIQLTLDGGATWTTKTVTAGWTRIQIAQTLADEDFGIRIVTDTGAVYVWNGQVETASFLSSDIATTPAAVTRNADVLTYAAAGNTTNVAMTVLAEYKVDASVSGGGVVSIHKGAAPTNDSFELYRTSSTTGLFEGFSGGIGVWSITRTGLSAGELVKLTGSASLSGALAVANGSVSSVASVAAMPTTLDTFTIGRSRDPNYLFGTVRNVCIWPAALTALQAAEASR